MSRLWLSRLGLIVPITLFAVFFAVYSVVWMTSAETVREEIASFKAREAEAGRTFTYTDIIVEGYPLMLRGAVVDPSWDAPGIGVFKADELTFAAVPTKADRVVLSPRGAQSIQLGETVYDLTSDDLRFNLQRTFLAAEGHSLTLASEERTVTIRDLIANQQQLADGQSVAISIKEVAFGGDAEAQMPYFDLYGSREGRELTVAGLVISISQASEEDATQLAGKGNLTISEDGTVDGAFDLSILNEGPMIDVLGAWGAVDEGAVDTVKMGVGLLTSSGTEEVNLPLRIENSEVRLGFIPLGTLPKIED
ncbi:MAG: DUF2125 domain-containing protein [Pseudomonadota bacterium]